VQELNEEDRGKPSEHRLQESPNTTDIGNNVSHGEEFVLVFTFSEIRRNGNVDVGGIELSIIINEWCHVVHICIENVCVNQFF